MSVPVGLPCLPLQALDPVVTLQTSGPARAAVSFVLTILFGGFVLYRHGGRIDGAVAASTSKPLRSLLYGFVAFGLALFVTGFAATQLIAIIGANTLVALVGVALIATAVLTLGGAGFVVVGVWLTANLGVRDPWIGLVTVGAGAALAWAVLPLVAAAVVCATAAAAGIGGPTRLWVHQDSEAIYD